MKTIRLVSWNINGIRAAMKKGLPEFLASDKPDIFCVQEIKALVEQVGVLPNEFEPYKGYWNSAVKKGYSGVATFCHMQTVGEPRRVSTGLDIPRFDEEGRVIMTEFPEFTLLNIYFPNGGREGRLEYKMDFYRDFLLFSNILREAGHRLIVVGDYNTAHKEIDLARPKENSKTTGFLPIERAWMDEYTQAGYVDTFRQIYPTEANRYTYWDQVSRARDRNVGWRIDYVFITPDLLPHLKDAFILDSVMGSDHCPLGVVLEF